MRSPATGLRNNAVVNGVFCYKKAAARPECAP
jgi:hypothetical protein